jgi:transcriptional regulator with XRE-family HTH domain
VTLLEAERRLRRWTQTELAFYADLSQGEISRFERRRALPSPRHAARLGHVLGVRPETLLDDVDVTAAELLPCAEAEVGR